MVRCQWCNQFIDPRFLKRADSGEYCHEVDGYWHTMSGVRVRKTAFGKLRVSYSNLQGGSGSGDA